MKYDLNADSVAKAAKFMNTVQQEQRMQRITSEGEFEIPDSFYQIFLDENVFVMDLVIHRHTDGRIIACETIPMKHILKLVGGYEIFVYGLTRPNKKGETMVRGFVGDSTWKLPFTETKL